MEDHSETGWEEETVSKAEVAELLLDLRVGAALCLDLPGVIGEKHDSVIQKFQGAVESRLFEDGVPISEVQEADDNGTG